MRGCGGQRRASHLPSASSIPPSSGADEKSFSRQTDEADMEDDLEYTSMWADISQHTLGKHKENLGTHSFVLGTTYGGNVTTLLD